MSISSDHISDTISIPLTQGQVAIVSNIDADLLNFKWCILKTPYGDYYAARHGRKILMHRVILERILKRSLTKDEKCDHIDRNKLNNQRNNLRVATSSQNAMNRARQSSNTSGYKGVTWNNARAKWQAQINVNKRYIYLGLFNTPEDAYEAYKRAAEKYHNEFKRTE